MNCSHYDAVVIGSGKGGNPLALALAKAGKRGALVERKHVGGTCVLRDATYAHPTLAESLNNLFMASDNT